MKINLNKVQYTPEGVLYDGRKVKKNSRLFVEIRRALAYEGNKPGWLEEYKDKKARMNVHHYNNARAVRAYAWERAQK